MYTASAGALTLWMAARKTEWMCGVRGVERAPTAGEDLIDSVVVDNLGSTHRDPAVAMLVNSPSRTRRCRFLGPVGRRLSPPCSPCTVILDGAPVSLTLAERGGMDARWAGSRAAVAVTVVGGS